jgi:predicted PurR-regulated permease PerM
MLSFVATTMFDDAPRILGVAGTYLVIATVEGQIVQPLFVGRRLQINPLLIFLGLWLGGLFWGIAGVLLATPALVGLKVISEHAVGGRAVLEFLGPNNPAQAQAAPLADLVDVLVERHQGERRAGSL